MAKARTIIRFALIACAILFAYFLRAGFASGYRGENTYGKVPVPVLSFMWDVAYEIGWEFADREGAPRKSAKAARLSPRSE